MEETRTKIYHLSELLPKEACVWRNAVQVSVRTWVRLRIRVRVSQA